MDEAMDQGCVTNLQELAGLFARQEGLAGRSIRGICGRVTKGRTPEDFQRLSDVNWKRLSWVMGPDGLEQLCGKSVRYILASIGKDTQWMRNRLNAGYKFKLFLFPEMEVVQATWDGVFRLIREIYPEAWPHVEPHTKALSQLSWTELQSNFSDFDIAEAYERGTEYHVFMTLERYLQSNRSLGYTRAFLFHEIGLSSLFHGDGFTRTEDGRIGVKEFMVANQLLTSLKESAVVDLHISLDEV